MFRSSNLVVLLLVLIAGYIAGARWPQYYGMAASKLGL